MSLRAHNSHSRLWLFILFIFLGCATSNVHRNWVDPSFKPDLLVVEEITVDRTAIRIDWNKAANISRQYLMEELRDSGLPCLIVDGTTLKPRMGTPVAIGLDSTTAILSAEMSITGIQFTDRPRFSYASSYTATLSYELSRACDSTIMSTGEGRSSSNNINVAMQLAAREVSEQLRKVWFSGNSLAK